MKLIQKMLCGLGLTIAIGGTAISVGGSVYACTKGEQSAKNNIMNSLVSKNQLKLFDDSAEIDFENKVQTAIEFIQNNNLAKQKLNSLCEYYTRTKDKLGFVQGACSIVLQTMHDQKSISDGEYCYAMTQVLSLDESKITNNINEAIEQYNNNNILKFSALLSILAILTGSFVCVCGKDRDGSLLMD